MKLRIEKMIKLNDFVLVGSVFGSIKSKINMPIFDSMPTVVLDNLLVTKYGERTLFPKLAGQTLDDLTDMILFTYSSKWQKLVTLDASGYDVAASKINTVTETVDNSENRVNVKDDINKVTAYNSLDLINNDGSESNSTDTMTGTTTRTVTDSTIDLTTAFNNLSLAEKNNIMNTVLYDVADFLTLSIYEVQQ